jgi:signal transduction histidine kinase
LLEPLSLIQAFLRSQLKPSEPAQATAIEEAYTLSLHLERQLQNFLLYALLETTAESPEKARLLQGSTPTPIKEIIANVAIEKAQQYGREADLTMDIGEGSIVMLETNLSKIAEELIDNAFKFSSPGATVLVKSNLQENRLVLDIYNQGAGLTQPQISELDAYVQFGRKLNGKGGAGLGLSIAKCLVNLHGGTFILESQPSQWTTVRIEFPTVQQNP